MTYGDAELQSFWDTAASRDEQVRGKTNSVGADMLAVIIIQPHGADWKINVLINPEFDPLDERLLAEECLRRVESFIAEGVGGQYVWGERPDGGYQVALFEADIPDLEFDEGESIL